MYRPIIEFFEEKNLFEISGQSSEKEKLDKIVDNIEQWLLKRVQQLKNVDLTTHPTSFTHPSAKKTGGIYLTSVIACSPFKQDGYLRSGNVKNIELDMRVTDAKDIPYTQLLSLRMQDGNTFLWHLKNNSDVKDHIFCKCSDKTFEKLKDGLIAVCKFQGKNCTSSKLKQVYFPVVDENFNYHQLTILFSSSLMFELKKRVNSEVISYQREGKKDLKTNEFPYKIYLNLTKISFGGKQPQNISYLNNKKLPDKDGQDKLFRGQFFFLPSLPPVLSDYKVKLPRKNFFAEVLWPGFYKEDLSALHKLFKADINNINIRQGRDNRILNIFDDIVKKIWAIRSSEIGWSEKERCAGLPFSQKIVLDDFYRPIRAESEEEISEFLNDIARWIIIAYQKVTGSDAIKLSDDELIYIKKLIESQNEVLL
ncbi:MAG: type I-F CRISPR-associated protein Csy1 [Candidatus Rifleibacteriota bacterium]